MAEVPIRRTCGAHDVHLKMLRTNPDYARARFAIQDHARAFIASAQAVARIGPTVIPVVVHVIHRVAEENISDQQIHSQIVVLNCDFRMKNPDVANVPAPFKPLVSDAMIEFALAAVDPDGKSTNGITRTKTNVVKFFSDDKMKFASEGGHDAWDTTRYLNIWVCPEILNEDTGDNLLGYAYRPGIDPAIDGVAIVHNGFGTAGSAANGKFNLGRTGTHEIGHWFDLGHIWGDKEDCVIDDEIADTPIQYSPNYDVPTFPHVSCNNGPNGDMFMNYMDYVDDKAMFMFTAGQVARMRATLAGPRATIGTPAVAALAGIKPPRT